MFEDKTVKIYSSRDMIRQQLIKYAENYLDIQPLDLTKTSYMSYLINVLSALTSNLIYYNSATYREFFLTRAQQKESVLNLSAMLGYTPDLATAAETKVLVQMPTNFSSTTFLSMTGRNDIDADTGKFKKPYKFYADDNVFEVKNTVEIIVIRELDDLGIMTTLDVSIKEYINSSTGSTQNVISVPWSHKTIDGEYIIYFNVNVVQVEDQSTTFTIPSVVPYEFLTKEIPITGDISYIDVRTRAVVSYSNVPRNISELNQDLTQYASDDWVVWDYTANKNSLYLINAGEHGYAWRVTEKGIKLFWGNNVIGTTPTAGDECVVTIGTTKGISGNVIAGSITKSDRLYARTYNQGTGELGSKFLDVKLACINISPATGGINYPTIDQIRKAALVQVSTNERLVTEYDYKNINTIVNDLPIQHAIPILKRSDIKQNEIVLFTDILYRDRIIPTRNETIMIDTTDYEADDEGHPIVTIHAGDIVDAQNIKDELTVGQTLPEYISMFDLTLDTQKRTASYRYVLDEVKEEIALQHSASIGTNQDGSLNVTPLTPNYTKYKVRTDENGDRYVDVFLVVQKNSSYNESSFYYMTAYCSIESNTAVEMERIDDLAEAYGTYQIIEFANADENSMAFKTSYILDGGEVDDGTLDFNYDIYMYIENKDPYDANYTPTWDYTISCKSTVVIKKDLNSYMYSMAGRLLNDGTPTTQWFIFDVPLILREWWDYMISIDLRDELVNYIFDRIVTFDVTEYRMMTDYVNLKFSNTYGPLTNMRFNPVSVGAIDGINPSYEKMHYYDTTTGDLAVWAVTNIGEHPWLNMVAYNDNTLIRTQAFVARQTTIGTDEYIFAPLSINDIMYMRSEDYDETIPLQSQRQKLIFNGESVVSVDKQIPLEVKLEIWLDPSFPSTEQSTVDRVKNNIIDQLFDKMGYDKPIYRSEIINIVQATDGVRHCSLINPNHDIFFNYSIYDDFTQEELLRYAPQLVQITQSHINVIVRS